MRNLRFGSRNPVYPCLPRCSLSKSIFITSIKLPNYLNKLISHFYKKFLLVGHVWETDIFFLHIGFLFVTKTPLDYPILIFWPKSFLTFYILVHFLMIDYSRSLDMYKK